jgi:hypothetical protein
MFQLDYQDRQTRRVLRQLEVRDREQLRQALEARRQQRRFRRLVGRTMVSIGRRLDADPVHQPARSR